MRLRKSERRQPMTWFRFADGTVRVVCSRGHASTLRHSVLPDGRLIAPQGQMSSCHCGTCNEDLPLVLEGWEP